MSLSQNIEQKQRERTWQRDRTRPRLGCIRRGDEVPGLTCRVSSSRSCPLSQRRTGSASDTTQRDATQLNSTHRRASFSQ